MPAQPLTSIPNGTDLFLDANILIYGLNGQSDQCRQLLERCSREEVTGICMHQVINDATHRFMLAEVKAKNLLADPRPNNVKGNCAVILQLNDYWQMTLRLLSMNFLVVNLDDNVVRGAETERKAGCLLTNDSMIVSCMRNWGITVLATNDNDFTNMNGITVYKPTDVLP